MASGDLVHAGRGGCSGEGWLSRLGIAGRGGLLGGGWLSRLGTAGRGGCLGEAGLLLGCLMRVPGKGGE